MYLKSPWHPIEGLASFKSTRVTCFPLFCPFHLFCLFFSFDCFTCFAVDCCPDPVLLFIAAVLLSSLPFPRGAIRL